MIYKLCRRCKRTIIHPAAYCDKCLDKVNQDREKLKSIRESKYNKNRDPKYKAFFFPNCLLHVQHVTANSVKYILKKANV